MPKRWQILIILLTVICIAYGVWSWSASVDKETEPFDGGSLSQMKGSPRSCKVYYTSNVDICDRPTMTEVVQTNVDKNIYNFYPIGKTEIQSHITRLEGIGTTQRTATQTSALADLKRALADIDSFPFRNTCALNFDLDSQNGFKESSAHPRKINQDYDAGRRGDPLHWAFCYYSSNATTQPIRDSEPFKRVFKDSGDDYANAGGATMRRYDMASMYNDDLLNLHCRIYTESLMNGGSSVSTFNGMRFMEWTLNPTPLTGTNRILTVRRMRPVRIKNGVLVVENDATEIKKAYLALIELVRTSSTLIHRQKVFGPTFYKFLFHLCSAPNTAAETPGAGVVGTETPIYNKLIQLAVPKTLPQVFRIPSTHPTISSEAYNYINNSPQGDISDMQFDIAKLDESISL